MFGQLWRDSGSWAALLIRHGVRAGDAVGLILPNRGQFVPILLGIAHGDGDGQPAAAVVAGMLRTFSGTGELTRDEILDNITLYWLTNTGVSASRLYWEYKGGFFNVRGVKIPAAVSVFPGEQYQAPRSWTERAYPKLIYYHQAEKGGHFAAWEQPKLFSEEVRAGFRPLRK